MATRRGELVHERRRQRGLPLPIAEKVLPFYLARFEAPSTEAPPNGEAITCIAKQAEEARLEEAWLRLAAAEQRRASTRELHILETAYLREAQSIAPVRARY